MTRVMILNDRTEAMRARLAERCPEADIATCERYADVPGMVESFRPEVLYSVTFAGRDGYPREAVKGAHGPAWLSVGGSGVDHMEGWDPARLTVTNSAGVASAMMAEYVMGAALHFTLDVAGLQTDQENRIWNPARRVQPLKGKTCLVVGLGNTGRAVAERAKAFGMRVIGTRARPEAMAHVDEVHSSDALPGLWGRADLIAVCVPLLPTTRKLVDARAFAAMKKSAILVDVSRGGVVDGAAITNAMRSGALAGAALDVFEAEPLPPDHALWGMENVLISPHCSAVFDGWDMMSFELFCDNLERWRAGEALQNVVDPSRGY